MNQRTSGLSDPLLDEAFNTLSSASKNASHDLHGHELMEFMPSDVMDISLPSGHVNISEENKNSEASIEHAQPAGTSIDIDEFAPYEIDQPREKTGNDESEQPGIDVIGLGVDESLPEIDAVSSLPVSPDDTGDLSIAPIDEWPDLGDLPSVLAISDDELKTLEHVSTKNVPEWDGEDIDGEVLDELDGNEFDDDYDDNYEDTEDSSPRLLPETDMLDSASSVLDGSAASNSPAAAFDERAADIQPVTERQSRNNGIPTISDIMGINHLSSIDPHQDPLANGDVDDNFSMEDVPLADLMVRQSTSEQSPLRSGSSAYFLDEPPVKTPDTINEKPLIISDADQFTQHLSKYAQETGHSHTPVLGDEDSLVSHLKTAGAPPVVGDLTAVAESDLEHEHVKNNTATVSEPVGVSTTGNKSSKLLVGLAGCLFAGLFSACFYGYQIIVDLKSTVEKQHVQYQELQGSFDKLNKLMRDDSGKTILDLLRDVNSANKKQKDEYSQLVSENARVAQQFQDDVVSRLEKVVQYVMNNSTSQQNESAQLRAEIIALSNQLGSLNTKDPRVEQLITQFNELSSKLNNMQGVIRSQTELTGLLENEQSSMKASIEKLSSRSSHVVPAGRTTNVSVQSAATPAVSSKDDSYSSELQKSVLLGVFLEDDGSYKLFIQDVESLNSSDGATYTYKPGQETIIPRYGRVLDVQSVDGGSDLVPYIVVTENGIIRGISR